jgi:hypothetical protein
VLALATLVLVAVAAAVFQRRDLASP